MRTLCFYTECWKCGNTEKREVKTKDELDDIFDFCDKCHTPTNAIVKIDLIENGKTKTIWQRKGMLNE